MFCSNCNIEMIKIESGMVIDNPIVEKSNLVQVYMWYCKKCGRREEIKDKKVRTK